MLKLASLLTMAVFVAGCGDNTSSSSLPSATSHATRASATEKVLYSFTDSVDGGGPNGGLVFDGSGNIFGTTHFGGNDTCGGEVGGGCGVVFELSPNGSTWKETPLYAFQDSSDGGFPNSGVILDKNGNVYGTGSTGGNVACSIGCGVVYELSKGSGWTESVLHAFDGNDGQFPNAALLASKGGAFYGTTWYGGISGNGAVFSLTPGSGGWKERVLYSFGGGADGSAPAGSVVADKAGNLYGTTYKYDGANDGVAFELGKKAGWKDDTLYNFADNGGGEDPYAGMIMPVKDKLYGTTIESGPSNGGTAFELVRGKKHRWSENVLHAFGATGDGNAPYGGLIADKKGNLYGTTVFGGSSNAGIVYELIPGKSGKWKETILYSFTGGSDGQYPSGSLTLDTAGNLYGATSNGGANGYGTIFEIVR